MTIPAPLEIYRAVVESDWIDYNGHMNVAYYVLVFDWATDAFLDFLGLDEALRAAAGSSTFSVEAHITYQREVVEGDPLRFTTQLLGYDEKRIHYLHRMYHAEAGFLASTIEWMTLHVDLKARKVGPMPAQIQARLAQVMASHAALPWPEEAGRMIRRPTALVPGA
ncbi:MAG: thioesterase family protein [Kiloniellales bacterium]|nr:thioesterase family protein [Kiloniellales bacterium]